MKAVDQLSAVFLMGIRQVGWTSFVETFCKQIKVTGKTKNNIEVI